AAILPYLSENCSRNEQIVRNLFDSKRGADFLLIVVPRTAEKHNLLDKLILPGGKGTVKPFPIHFRLRCAVLGKDDGHRIPADIVKLIRQRGPLTVFKPAVVVPAPCRELSLRRSSRLLPDI